MKTTHVIFALVPPPEHVVLHRAPDGVEVIQASARAPTIVVSLLPLRGASRGR